MIFRHSDQITGLNLTAEELHNQEAAVGIFVAGQTNLTIEDKVKLYFEQLREPIFRYLTATFGGAAEQAEEITQETFLQLYRAFNQGQTLQNVRAWLFRVAHNKAINQLKRQQFVASVNEEDWAVLENSLENKGLNPEQTLIQKEKLNRLRKAINRLTVTERECLHLRTKGFRYREIGEILEIGTTTVSDTLARVIEKLAKETNG